MKPGLNCAASDLLEENICNVTFPMNNYIIHSHES